jgi:hypothetical protein
MCIDKVSQGIRPFVLSLAFSTVVLLPASALAQQTVSKGQVATTVMTIQAIDSTNRMITVKLENGEEDTIAVGPEVKRFNEFKVGDRIRATYYESTVYQLRKPGEATAKAKDEIAGTTGAGKTPSATIARQQTTTVTVQKVNTNPPSLTVQTQDGRTVTRKVDNPKNIENVKPGDRIDITYTQALLAEIELVK